MDDKLKRLSHEYLSPAKINLFFRVLSKRNDGFHEVGTLMQAVDLSDRLFFLLSEKDHISCSDLTLPVDKNNLVVKALTLFRNTYLKRIGADFSVAIHLEKHIPKEAGLGGGSSNAATTLFALNELLDNPFTLEELKEMGAKIGSDVPFFFTLGMGYGSGRGEKLTDFKMIPSKYFLVKPLFGLSTAKVFSHCSVDGMSKRDPKELLQDLLERMQKQKAKIQKGNEQELEVATTLEIKTSVSNVNINTNANVDGNDSSSINTDIDTVKSTLSQMNYESLPPTNFVNDLEKPAFFLKPKLKEIKEALIKQGFADVTMTGSGTTFFMKSNEKPPKIPNTLVFPVSSIERKDGAWYKVT